MKMVWYLLFLALFLGVFGIRQFALRRTRRRLDKDPVQIQLTQMLIEAGQNTEVRSAKIPSLLLSHGYSANECRIRLQHASQLTDRYFSDCRRHSREVAATWRILFEDDELRLELVERRRKE